MLQPPSLEHSSLRAGPAAACIAPSTPPPPSRVLLAAFTMLSTCISVISPRNMYSFELSWWQGARSGFSSFFVPEDVVKLLQTIIQL